MSCGEKLAQELRARRYRVTPQRAVILETIAHLPGHHTANEVFEISRQRLPALNLATVYRTLETLHEANMVDLFNREGYSLQYALRDPAHPHGHLICQCCGNVIEFDLALLDCIQRSIQERYQFQIDCSHLSLHGRCASCKQENTGS